MQEELEHIHAEGRSKPPVQARLQTKYPTSWWYQLVLLLRRDAEAHWRDPVYLIAKMALNIASALLIGFTFFKASTSIQGTQNHLFVRRSHSSGFSLARMLSAACACRRSSCR